MARVQATLFRSKWAGSGGAGGISCAAQGFTEDAVLHVELGETAA
jgi:hypothetical protein